MMNRWLDRGVDGFRMDVISLLAKHPQLPDGKGSGYVSVSYTHLDVYKRQEKKRLSTATAAIWEPVREKMLSSGTSRVTKSSIKSTVVLHR